MEHSAYAHYLQGDVEQASKLLWRYHDIIGDCSHVDSIGNHWRLTDFRDNDKIWTVVKKNGTVNNLSYEEYYK